MGQLNLVYYTTYLHSGACLFMSRLLYVTELSIITFFQVRGKIIYKAADVLIKSNKAVAMGSMYYSMCFFHV